MEQKEQRGPKKSVCVIGAGLSGLVTTKALLDEGLSVTAFEQYPEAGGTWVLREPHDGTHTSMYPDLLTNLTPDIMQLPNFPFPDDTPLFFSHSRFKDYLQSYAKHFDLLRHIEFNSSVTKCEFLFDSHKWRVSVLSKGSSVPKVLLFDFLAVCSGHYFQPNMPHFRGQENFPGKIMHTHDFRHGADFKDKNVLIVGAGNSALDVIHFIKPMAKSLHISSRSLKLVKAYKPLAADKPEIDSLTSSGEVIFKDGSKMSDVDIIMCATGYQYHYPFLEDSIPSLVAPRGACINRLFEHVWWIDNPTVAFLDIPWKSLPSKVTSFQSVWIAGVWSGKLQLPSREEMLKVVSDRRKELAKSLEEDSSDPSSGSGSVSEPDDRGTVDPDGARVDRFMHCLAGEERFRYIDRLAEYSHLPKMPQRIVDGYKSILPLRLRERGY